MFTISPKQARVKAFLVAKIAETGTTPSYQEIATGLGMKSKSGVHAILSALEARGHIERLPGRHRAIRVIDDAASGLSGKGE